MHIRKKLALVCYPAEYFHKFSLALENNGYDIFWICALNSDYKYLLSKKIEARKILNIQNGFNKKDNFDLCTQNLAQYETTNAPTVSDIIMMDRLLSKKKWDFSVLFLSHTAKKIDAFIKNNDIQLLSSWRDTAPQLTAMLVAKNLKIPFIIPTRIRIPQEVYGFCTEHHTDSFIKLRETTNEDLIWAENFLISFENRTVTPALKKSTRSFLDIIKLMPSHLNAFLYELRRSFDDVNNDFTRYKIPTLIAMYFKRRWNLLIYKLKMPAKTLVDFNSSYCLYALHTQPESSIDVQASALSNQLELIRIIARNLPLSCPLYVKVHPTDVDGKPIQFYKDIAAIPNVYLLNYNIDSRMLLNRAKIIFALTGTIAYEAGLLQKNVIIFAKNYFNHLPTIKYCTELANLNKMVDEILIIPHQTNNTTRTKIIEFIGSLRAGCFDGEVSRTYGASNEALNDQDLKTAVTAYDSIYKMLVSSHEHP